MAASQSMLQAPNAPYAHGLESLSPKALKVIKQHVHIGSASTNYVPMTDCLQVSSRLSEAVALVIANACISLHEHECSGTDIVYVASGACCAVAQGLQEL